MIDKMKEFLENLTDQEAYDVVCFLDENPYVREDMVVYICETHPDMKN